MPSPRIPSRRPVLLRAAAAALGAAALPGVLRAQARTTLTWAAATFSEAGRGERLRAWVDKFNQSQRTVAIEPVAIPFASFAKTVFTQMGGGAGPDLLRLDLVDYHAAVQVGRVLALDGLIDGASYPMTAADKYMFIAGKRYGVPFETSNYVLLYNRALLAGAAPPAGFDAFLASARAASGNGVYGFAFRATMAEAPGFWQDLCNFVYGFGGRWSDAQGNLTLDAGPVIAGVAAYKKVYDAGVTPKGADAATYRRMFWEGKLAMELDNGGVAGIFNQQAPQLPLAAVPAPFPTRAQGMILTALAINANTRQRAAAQAFVRWTLRAENQKELQDLLGASNVATVVVRSPEDLAQKPWLAVYDAQTPHGLPQLVAGLEVKTPQLQQIVLEQVLRVLQGGLDPAQAMAQAQRLALARVLRK